MKTIKMTFDVYGHIIRRKETDELNEDGGILHYVTAELLWQFCGK